MLSHGYYQSSNFADFVALIILIAMLWEGYRATQERDFYDFF